MSKLRLLVFSVLLLSSTVPAQQVLVHQFFPMGINGDMLGDTLINKREILVKAGIRKMMIRQIPPFVTTSFASKTYSLDQNGNIETLQYCIYNPKSDSTYCLNNVFTYASNGQSYELKTSDAKESMYMHYTVEQLDKNSEKHTSATFNRDKSGDTLIDYKYYNEKGQLTKLTQLRKAQEPFHSFFYYNNDGLLDSVNYRNTHWPTTKFSRKHKRKDRIVEMEHTMGRYSWIYNSTGQCIRILFETKIPGPITNQQPYLFGNPKTKYIKKMEVFYYYNSNGTLSKATEKYDKGRELSVIYSYE